MSKENKELASQEENDILFISEDMEEETMLARYHFENVIYLYGVFEKETANQITGSNTAKMPLKLYETPQTAKKASANANILNPIILRFAVRTPFEPYTYDSLIEESKMLLSKSGMSLQEYIKKCKYVRNYDSKEKMIVYTINDSALIVNVQVI